MAEAMTVETIVEADWIMKGYWTKLRYPFKTTNGWSDIDILAYAPEQKELVISESKVRGPKKLVMAYTRHTKKAYGDIIRFDGDNYFSFLRHIKTICKDGVVFADFSRMVKSLKIQLVSNYFVSGEMQKDVELRILKKIRKSVPKGIKLKVLIETTLQVISRIIETEDAKVQGRRYGHPVLDIAREINRYIHPTIQYAGRSRKESNCVKNELASILKKSLRWE